MADAEIDAMVALSGAFDGLDDDARARVLRWAADKYSVKVPLTPRERETAGGRPTPDDEVDEPSEESQQRDEPSGPRAFEHFAELYDAANPTTRADEALVAGYWFQKVKGVESFGSQELNKELKNLGRYLPEINKNLATNIDKKPALVLQLKKSGNTRQGRKTYKLSVEGIKAVERMLAKRPDDKSTD